ncbi:MAG: hypothetical protein U1E11_05590 [Dethiobacteria bacterium]|nr:hypothetical protein [Dethiobacteria bacterium]
MNAKRLEEIVINLLEPGIFKTTAQVVEEIRIEFPALWRQLEEEGEMLFGSSCSSLQQPATRISQVLQSLSNGGQFICRRENNIFYWSSY